MSSVSKRVCLPLSSHVWLGENYLNLPLLRFWLKCTFFFFSLISVKSRHSGSCLSQRELGTCCLFQTNRVKKKKILRRQHFFTPHLHSYSLPTCSDNNTLPLLDQPLWKRSELSVHMAQTESCLCWYVLPSLLFSSDAAVAAFQTSRTADSDGLPVCTEGEHSKRGKRYDHQVSWQVLVRTL